MKGTVEEHLIRLRYEINEASEFHESSIERIKAWYLADRDSNEEYVEALRRIDFDVDVEDIEKLDPPHEDLADRAAAFVKDGIRHEQRGRSRINRDASPRDIGEILLGTGVEALLKAIVLKEDPEYFVDNAKNGELPGFQCCRSRLRHTVGRILSDEQMRYYQIGLDAIWEYRNDTVHEGLRSHRFLNHWYLMYHVIEFLFREFFEDRSEVIKRLSGRRKEIDQNSAPEYPLLELK